MIIAIDGPAGSGKSSVAKLLAEQLDLPFLNSGLLFRSLAWTCLELGVDVSNGKACADVVAKINLEVPDHEQVIVSYDTIKDRKLSSELRSKAVDEAVHSIAGLPDVRREVLALKRKIAKEQGGVIEGRTIGTYDFPDADFKFWLTADPQIRLARVTAQRGAEAASAMMARDEHDATREHEPMVPADDAIHVDSGSMNIDEVVEYMIKKVRKK